MVELEQEGLVEVKRTGDFDCVIGACELDLLGCEVDEMEEGVVRIGLIDKLEVVIVLHVEEVLDLEV